MPIGPFVPGAKNDLYSLFEGISANAIVSLSVLSNDQGGAANVLYSVDDGSGNPSSPTDLRVADAVNGVSPWEPTAGGNAVRIFNGVVQLDFTHALAGLGASTLNGLTAADVLNDSFIYAFRYANGTLSWAKVTVSVQGQNDAASISGQASGTIGEDAVLPVTGTLVVSDPDHGQAHTQVVTNGNTANGYGTWSVDADGHWSFVVNNALVQHLNSGQHVTDSFVVASLDGTAQQTVTITIEGADEAEPWHPTPANATTVGISGAARLYAVAADGTITDSGITLSNGGQTAYDSKIADVDGDGDADVLVTGDNGAGRIHYNNGDGTFSDSGALFPGSFQTKVVAADIDDDGDLDPYFHNVLSDPVLYRNDGGANYPPILSVDGPVGNPNFADFDGDGSQDIYAGADTIFFNDGAGGFTSQTIGPYGPVGGNAVGDVNGDGFVDIVRGDHVVLINDGTGEFTVGQTGFGPVGGVGSVLGDIDGNGTLDAMMFSSAGAEWWSNDGTGFFTFAVAIRGNGFFGGFADFNGDDAADVYGYEYDTGTLVVLLNSGTGTFPVADLLVVPGGTFGAHDAGLIF